MVGLDKTGSDSINVIILNVVLTDNKMVDSFLGHGSKVSTKFFSSKKEALDMLMIGLRKHSNRVVQTLKESAVDKRIKTVVLAAREMTQVHPSSRTGQTAEQNH